MSDRLRELEAAARAVCECAERGPMHIGPPDECRVVPRLIEALRAALDTEPEPLAGITDALHDPMATAAPAEQERLREPAPTNEERARSSDLASVVAWGIAEHGEEHGAKLIDEALAAAEARGLERAAAICREMEAEEYAYEIDGRRMAEHCAFLIDQDRRTIFDP